MGIPTAIVKRPSLLSAASKACLCVHGYHFFVVTRRVCTPRMAILAQSLADKPENICLREQEGEDWGSGHERSAPPHNWPDPGSLHRHRTSAEVPLLGLNVSSGTHPQPTPYWGSLRAAFPKLTGSRPNPGLSEPFAKPLRETPTWRGLLRLKARNPTTLLLTCCFVGSGGQLSDKLIGWLRINGFHPYSRASTTVNGGLRRARILAFSPKSQCPLLFIGVGSSVPTFLGPAVGDEFGTGGLDAGGIASEHQGDPGSRAAAFVSAVSLGQHGANEEGEHDAGVDRSGSLGRHEKDEHAAGHPYAAVCVGVPDVGQHLRRELA